MEGEESGGGGVWKGRRVEGEGCGRGGEWRGRGVESGGWRRGMESAGWGRGVEDEVPHPHHKCKTCTNHTYCTTNVSECLYAGVYMCISC